MSLPGAVVSGGSRGLGLALVQRFLEADHRVATFARAETPELRELGARFPGRLTFAAVDATDPAELDGFLARALEGLDGRVDVLVNNAAIGLDGMLALARPNEIDRVLAANVGGALHLTRGVARAMLRESGGCIVNISSVNALRGHAGVAVYSATKAALDGITRSLARELGDRSIRVNSVAPGYFDTAMVSGLDDRARGRIVRRTPLGRLGTVDDVCEAVLWLCSPKAAFVTGHVLVVDGGLTC